MLQLIAVNDCRQQTEIVFFVVGVALFPPPTSFSATIQTQSFLAAGVLPSVGYEVPSSKIPKLDTAGKC